MSINFCESFSKILGITLLGDQSLINGTEESGIRIGKSQIIGAVIYSI